MENEVGAARDITGSIRAQIIGNPEEVDSPLYAINWFNTRLAFVYHFYNLLAASRVFRIGAKVLFKGKCQQMIGGDAEMARQFLLIVNYPSGTRFMDLLADRIFQLVSVFRVMAVKEFSFVFHKRREVHQTPEAGQKFDASECYAVLHLKNSANGTFDDRLTDLDRIAASQKSEIYFAGSMVGQVVLSNSSSGKQDPMSFITDSTVVFKAADKETMVILFDSAEMQEFLAAAPGHFASYIKRTM